MTFEAVLMVQVLKVSANNRPEDEKILLRHSFHQKPIVDMIHTLPRWLPLPALAVHPCQQHAGSYSYLPRIAYVRVSHT